MPRLLAAQNRRAGARLSIEDLKDATQEAIAITWRKLAEYRGDASLVTWVASICHFVLMNAARKTRRQPVPASAIGDGSQLEVAVATDASPHDFGHVYACLERLPDRDAQIVRARAFEELEFEEIARRTGLGVGGLKSRYYRALRRLRDCLDAAEAEQQ